MPYFFRRPKPKLFIILGLSLPTICLHRGVTECFQHLHFRPRFCQMTVSPALLHENGFCSVDLCFNIKYYPAGRDGGVDLQGVHVNTQQLFHLSLFQHWYSSILGESGASVTLNPVTAIRQEMSGREKPLWMQWLRQWDMGFQALLQSQEPSTTRILHRADTEGRISRIFVSTFADQPTDPVRWRLVSGLKTLFFLISPISTC